MLMSFIVYNRNDPDVLFPDLPLQQDDEQAAEEILSGLLDSDNTDNTANTATADADAVEEEKVREQQEQEQKHLHQQALSGGERGIERGFNGSNNSDSRTKNRNSANPSSESENENESDVSDAEKEEGEEERVERVAGDYGEEDDMWTDKEVIMFCQ